MFLTSIAVGLCTACAPRNQRKSDASGDLAIPEVVPRLSDTPGEIRWLGEGLGAQNTEVFGGLLGLDSDDLGALREQGII